MDFPLRMCFLVLLWIEFILGITLNSFIVATTCMEWMTFKRLGTSDKILACLGLSRFFHQWGIMLHNIFRIHLPVLYAQMYFYAIFLVVTMFLKFSSLWFATVLCVYYCVKITNYNHSLFIYVKVRINKIVPWLLLASLLTSVASSLPLCWYIMNGNNSKNSLLKNSTVQDIIVVQNHTKKEIVNGLGISLPFTIFCVATFLLIKSLWLHTRQMRSSGMGIRSPSLDTHFRVVKSMVFFLLLYIIFFSSMNVIFSKVLPIGSPWLVFLSILTSAYPFLHSAVLIFYNKKLKQTLLNICHRAVKFTQNQRISAKSSTDFTTGRPH
ncbi:hypothetical protein FKM82_018895, partial [Ascaphus truei]